jgi:hypothetical protein
VRADCSRVRKTTITRSPQVSESRLTRGIYLKPHTKRRVLVKPNNNILSENLRTYNLARKKRIEGLTVFPNMVSGLTVDIKCTLRNNTGEPIRLRAGTPVTRLVVVANVDKTPQMSKGKVSTKYPEAVANLECCGIIKHKVDVTGDKPVKSHTYKTNGSPNVWRTTKHPNKLPNKGPILAKSAKGFKLDENKVLWRENKTAKTGKEQWKLSTPLLKGQDILIEAQNENWARHFGTYKTFKKIGTRKRWPGIYKKKLK